MDVDFCLLEARTMEESGPEGHLEMSRTQGTGREEKRLNGLLDRGSGKVAEVEKVETYVI